MKYINSRFDELAEYFADPSLIRVRKCARVDSRVPPPTNEIENAKKICKTRPIRFVSFSAESNTKLNKLVYLMSASYTYTDDFHNV